MTDRLSTEAGSDDEANNHQHETLTVVPPLNISTTQSSMLLQANQTNNSLLLNNYSAPPPDVTNIENVIYESTLDAEKPLMLLPNDELKGFLKVFNITGAQNARNATKRKIIAMKMVQRAVSMKTMNELQDAIDENDFEDLSTFATELKNISKTSVKVSKVNRVESFTWASGDVPIFQNGEVVIGMPLIESRSDPIRTSEASSAQIAAPFQADEYCRLMHVISDPRMTSARQLLTTPRSREQLENPVDPWSDHIINLFNDPEFKPTLVPTPRDGITKSVIDSLRPSERPFERDALLLSRKFAELRSQYSIANSRYSRSGQGEHDAFPEFTNRTYVMYLHCIIIDYPFLEDLSTRAVPSDCQWEEGSGTHDIGQTEFSDRSPSVSTKRKRGNRDNDDGLIEIAKALKVQNPGAVKETEEAERDRARDLATDAYAQSSKSLLSAIKDVKVMRNSASNEVEKDIYEDTLQDLLKQLKKHTNRS